MMKSHVNETHLNKYMHMARHDLSKGVLEYIYILFKVCENYNSELPFLAFSFGCI